MDVSCFSREATHCFMDRRFLACIAMSSAAVEIILNRDRRLWTVPDFRSSDGWAYLNNRTLRIAEGHGLPSNELLASGENLSDRAPIAFVEVRNKVAHGEIAKMVNNLSDYDSNAEKMATEQAEKMRRFVSKWYNTAPDVQEGHIKNNQWPMKS